MPQFDRRQGRLAPERARAILRARIDELASFRHALHRWPELSDSEARTAASVVEALSATEPTEIVDGLGGHGVAAVFASPLPGPTILLRAELDALPMLEPEGLPHRSMREGMSHKCGHDGHMASLIGVANVLAEIRPPRGRIVLLFQPAEETGAGAARVLADPKFEAIRPDMAFALHNLPGLPLAEVRVGPGVFTVASVGLSVRLRGLQSHASSPHLGRSPARASARFVDRVMHLADEPSTAPAGALITVTGIHMGQRSFGISPGEADILLTLRCHDSADLSMLISRAETLAQELAAADGLSVEIARHDEFPASVNDPAAASAVARVAAELGLSVLAPPEPFPWSEDFGHFVDHCGGALFVVGAGEGAPPLHTSGYDFPDALIEPAAMMLMMTAFRVLEDDSEEDLA